MNFLINKIIYSDFRNQMSVVSKISKEFLLCGICIGNFLSQDRTTRRPFIGDGNQRVESVMQYFSYESLIDQILLMNVDQY